MDDNFIRHFVDKKSQFFRYFYGNFTNELGGCPSTFDSCTYQLHVGLPGFASTYSVL
jgi:hypothetical protein